MTYLNSRSSGISILSLLFLFLFFVDDLSAQDKTNRISISHPVSNSIKKEINTPKNLKIIGVMVEFQPDTTRFTSGDGTFGPGSIPYLENPGTTIDALPHNKSYFEAHLEFSKNYFETVSNGNLTIDFEVLPEVYRLNHPMAYYSPTGENPDLSVMTQFIIDVWTAVGTTGDISTNFNSGDNIAFAIFHAGVGRDIELTGTNLDKTPQDLPSFYLSKKTLSDYLNDPSFAGFPINNGNLLVDNSLIVPRTLTRAGEDAVENRFVLPLSINGLLTAQIGSHIGLPDLFNTETGRSGIGQFGLMDGAGIFAYNGLFPPEPSAWEKSYLGWISPFSVESDNESPISLPAASFHEDESTAKISISNEEYFLVENRHRDPSGNGVTLTIKKNDGSYLEQTFTNSDTEFTNQEADFDELLEPGVVVKASNYDFSLPGGLISDSESDSEEALNGGILIWHIDEGIINNNISLGRINDNPDRRGVDLEEADGAQDIGRPTTIGLFQNEVNGSAFDFWWAGNNANVIIQSDTLQLFKNRFGPDTTPNNDSNSGAPSYFELFDFSENLPTASFRIQSVNPFDELYELWDFKPDLSIATVTTSNKYWKRYPLALQPISADGEEWIMIPGHEGIQFYQPDNKILSENLMDIPSLQQPFITGNKFTVAKNPSEISGKLDLSVYQFDGTNIHEKRSYQVSQNRSFVSSFTNDILDIDGTTDRINLSTDEIIQTDKPVQFSDQNGEYQSKIENGSLILNFPRGSESFLLNQTNDYSRLYTGLVQTSTNETSFYLLEDGQLSIFTPTDNYQDKKILYSSGFIDWPAFTDFNQDGYTDFLFVDYSSNQVIAKNLNGAFLSSFPISTPQNVHFQGTPLIADINGDDTNELIISGYDNYSMNLYAYNENAELVDGFPLYVGGIKDIKSQPVHPLISGDKLFAVSHSGDLKVWEFKNMQNVQWRSKYGNQTTNKISGFIDAETPVNPQLSLLNKEETYNWPNPAVDETQLRYQTSKPAEIHIKILTMSGRIMGEHTFQSKGSVAEELKIDTSSWASGGYVALVEAKADGKTERKLVKIAIAR